MLKDKPHYPTSLRLLGMLPFLFFFARLWASYREGTVGNIFWLCHFSNLTLAVGLLIGWRFWIRFSAPWLAFGLPLWLWNLSIFGIGSVTTLGTHVGGAIVGLFALAQIGIEKYSWIYAGLWLFLLQAISRIITDPMLNVNVAHGIYFGWETMFTAYWQYWLATTLLAWFGLWLMNRLFYLWWPVPISTS